MKAKFKDTAYEIMNNELNVSPARFQVCLIKGNLSVDNIISDVMRSTQIQIIENNQVIGIYGGYTNLLAITFMKEFGKEDSYIVSVELENPAARASMGYLDVNDISNIEMRVNTLGRNVVNLKNVQDTQSQTIDSLNSEINGKLDANMIGNVETIGTAASQSYEVGSKFVGSDGNYYKATTPIITGSVLVVGGNCEVTTISEEINK